MKIIETHEAIFDRVSRALDRSITLWDYLPSNVSPPYVVLGKVGFELSGGLQTKLSTGYILTQKIHVITKTEEKHKAVRIMNTIIEALQEDLSIRGATVLRQFFTVGEVEETSNEEFYGEIDFSLWLED